MTTRRRYYDDSSEREFDASVTSCEPSLHGSIPAWGVLLDSTAFYPTSGGQPHDVGKLGDANVFDVREEDSEIVHIIDRKLEKRSVHGCIDWTRRFDHMQQHTGQHLLSAMFQERYGRPTVSFHLGADLCSIDLQGPEPSGAILEGAERAANQVIFEDRSVTVRYGTADQLADLGVRKKVDRQGILRAIEIEGADLQPCGGTHVQRTSQIGVLLVRRCTKSRQDWRVEFVCGGRAERVARQDYLLLRGVAEKLGCASEDVVTAAERAATERDAHFKASRSAVQRLAEAEATLALHDAPPATAGPRLFTRVFPVNTQPEYLASFASQLAKSENTIALLAIRDAGHLVFAQHPSAGRDMNSLLRRAFEQFAGKGGGTRDFARGCLTDVSQADRAIGWGQEMLTPR